MSFGNTRLLSVVVIGLNEQSRLKASLEAIFACKPQGFDLEVLYVDSGSTDGSVGIAEAIPGVQVVRLDGSRRSAARGRNVGLRLARGEYVQLVDGDSVLQPGWIETGLAILQQTPEIACVFGQCVEMYPEQSIYMKLCGFDWHIAPGDRRFCGGNSLWRREVIAAEGYFDESLRIGEEPDLCYRVRRHGGRIVCVDAPMVTHDLAMRRFGQYWRRAMSSGRGYAAIAGRYWRRSEKLWLREAVLNFAEPLLWLAIFAIGSAIGGMAWGAAAILGWWLMRASQIAYAMRGRKVRAGDALLYGLHCQFVRLPAAVGQLQVLFRSR
jgi:GT2 family glycosyltransferase